jgi:hypothetical protein
MKIKINKKRRYSERSPVGNQTGQGEQAMPYTYILVAKYKNELYHISQR